MFAIFIIQLGIIATIGPGHIEHGFDALHAKGFSAIEDGLKAGKKLKSDHTGNYGNS